MTFDGTASTVTLDDVISYMEATDPETWNLDTVRSQDGKNNCFFGHLFNMGRDEQEANRIWGWFEEAWATTYRIYPINDGQNPRYQQPTSKERVLAFLYALRAGKELTTMEQMEADYQAYIEAEAAI